MDLPPSAVSPLPLLFLEQSTHESPLWLSGLLMIWHHRDCSISALPLRIATASSFSEFECELRCLAMAPFWLKVSAIESVSHNFVILRCDIFVSHAAALCYFCFHEGQYDQLI